MNFDPTVAQQFLDAISSGDTENAVGLAASLIADPAVSNLAVFDAEDYNDEELVKLMQADLDQIPHGSVALVWGTLIPRFIGRTISFIQDYALENAEWDDENGETDSESVGESTGEDATGS